MGAYVPRYTMGAFIAYICACGWWPSKEPVISTVDLPADALQEEKACNICSDIQSKHQDGMQSCHRLCIGTKQHRAAQLLRMLTHSSLISRVCILRAIGSYGQDPVYSLLVSRLPSQRFRNTLHNARDSWPRQPSCSLSGQSPATPCDRASRQIIKLVAHMHMVVLPHDNH